MRGLVVEQGVQRGGNVPSDQTASSLAAVPNAQRVVDPVKIPNSLRVSLPPPRTGGTRPIVQSVPGIHLRGPGIVYADRAKRVALYGATKVKNAQERGVEVRTRRGGGQKFRRRSAMGGSLRRTNGKKR